MRICRIAIQQGGGDTNCVAVGCVGNPGFVVTFSTVISRSSRVMPPVNLTTLAVSLRRLRLAIKTEVVVENGVVAVTFSET